MAISRSDFGWASNAAAADTNTLTFALDAGAGSNRCILLVMGAGLSGATGNNITITNATFAVSNTFTLFTNSPASGGVGEVELWYLTDPDSNTNTIVVDIDQAHDDWAIGAVSLSGVDQTTPIGTTNQVVSNVASTNEFVTNITVDNLSNWGFAVAWHRRIFGQIQFTGTNVFEYNTNAIICGNDGQLGFAGYEPAPQTTFVATCSNSAGGAQSWEVIFTHIHSAAPPPPTTNVAMVGMA